GPPTIENLLAFAPANVQGVFGGSTASLRTKPDTLGKLIFFVSRYSPMITFQEMQLLNTLDKDVFFTTGDPPAAGGRKDVFVAAMTFLDAQDPEKLRQTMGADKGKSVQGKTIYPMLRKLNEFVAIPTPRMVLLSSGISEGDFVKILDGKSQIPAE